MTPKMLQALREAAQNDRPGGATMPDDELEANINLIAAAPDLLAALKALVPEIEEEIVQRQVSGNDEEWRNLSDLSDAAVLAIAKAEGRL